MSRPDDPLLFFDGVCNLCHAAVRFVIRHDRRARIRFASLQSAAGQRARAALQLDTGEVPDSLILYHCGRYYIGSEAALRLAGLVDGGWKALSWLRVIPRFVRDPVYRFVARNRYRWFGRKAACPVPTPALKARFLED